MSIDSFFRKRYNSSTYNCAHFACDVWKHETGSDICEALKGFLLPRKERYVKSSIRKSFIKLDKPESPSLVLMQRNGAAPHIGVYLRGRVLHIQKDGVQFQPLDVACIGFNKVSYYK